MRGSALYSSQGSGWAISHRRLMGLENPFNKHPRQLMGIEKQKTGGANAGKRTEGFNKGK